MEIDLELVRRTFTAESLEQLSEMEQALLELELAPESAEPLRTAFRVVHTLKGSASSVGCDAVAEFAHVVEDLLQRLRNGEIRIDAGAITLLLESTDAFQEMIRREGSGEENCLEHDRLKGRIASAARGEEVEGNEESEQALCLSPEQTAEDRTGSPRRSRASTLRVGIEKLDRMLNLAGEIAIARAGLGQMLEGVTGTDGQRLREAHREGDRLAVELQEEVSRVRMTPIEPTLRQCARTARDAASACGKQVRLVIEGGSVEADARVIEHLRAPMMHMVRNAIDHGIELPQVRQDAGKDPIGTLTLRACNDSGAIVIACSDDGAGVDRERILARARSLGMLTESETPTDREVFALMFRDGFSTAKAVTELSGRGVGMDVVHRNAETLGGSVSVESQPGDGTTVSIRLPLTLAIIDGLAIGVGEQTYLLPLPAVVECLDVGRARRNEKSGSGLTHYRGTGLPRLRLRDLFGIGGGARARGQIIVLQHGAHLVGLEVDEVYGEQQIVIKPLGPLLRSLPGISGCAILSNGRVAPILDVPGVLALASAGRGSQSDRFRPAAVSEESETRL